MVSLNVKVVPGASRDRVVGRYGNGIKVQVSAPPEDGKANRAVLQVLAAFLEVRPERLQIVRGQTQPRKVVQVTGLEPAGLQTKLAALD